MFNRKLKARVKLLEEENRRLRTEGFEYPTAHVNDYMDVIKEITRFAVAQNPTAIQVIDFIRTQLQVLNYRKR